MIDLQKDKSLLNKLIHDLREQIEEAEKTHKDKLDYLEEQLEIKDRFY